MAETKIKYPSVEVQITGHDGNAYAVVGRVAKALKRAGVRASRIDKFREEAFAGDYDELLRTCDRWVVVS